MVQAGQDGSAAAQRIDWKGTASGNRILADVSDGVRDEILENASLVHLSRGDQLDRCLSRGNVVFPLSGVYGGVLETEDSEYIQPIFVGSEGVIGGMRSLHQMPYFLSFKVRLPGEAVIIAATVLRRLAAEHPSLRLQLARAADRSFHLAAVHAVCARYHSLPTRCCSWLSLLHREAGDDVVPITHQELAEVVGATRPAVSATLSQLNRQGLVSTIRRGALRLLDPAQVSRQSCACWIIADSLPVDWDVEAAG